MPRRKKTTPTSQVPEAWRQLKARIPEERMELELQRRLGGGILKYATVCHCPPLTVWTYDNLHAALQEVAVMREQGWHAKRCLQVHLWAEQPLPAIRIHGDSTIEAG